MGIRNEDFRRMPLAVWRAYKDAYAEAERGQWQRAAWQVSLQLVAAGCKAEDVSPAKLLGEEKRMSLRQRIERDPEVVKQRKVERFMDKWRKAAVLGDDDGK